MQPTTVSGESSLHLTNHSRSLWINFARPLPAKEVVVILHDRLSRNLKYNLQVITANTRGIEVKLPQMKTGIYLLKIKDGQDTFQQQVAIQ